MDVIADAMLAWAHKDWRPRCPHCGDLVEEFTTHTMICDNDGPVDTQEVAFAATPWVA